MAANKPCAEGETESFQVEYRLQHKDGSWRWILGWLLDITDRKKASGQLRRNTMNRRASDNWRSVARKG